MWFCWCQLTEKHLEMVPYPSSVKLAGLFFGRSLGVLHKDHRSSIWMLSSPQEPMISCVSRWCEKLTVEKLLARSEFARRTPERWWWYVPPQNFNFATLGQLWDNFDTTFIQLFDNFETTLINLDTTLRQLKALLRDQNFLEEPLNSVVMICSNPNACRSAL